MKPKFSELLLKYDVPVPRYTSYPTVPAWKQAPTSEQWFSDVRGTLSEADSSWSLYLHIPFCESLCTFCGCNTIITKDHKKEGDYVDLILSEWALYLKNVPDLKVRPLKHLHLGGGTPTFLSPDQLQRMLESILSSVTKSKIDFEASIEVDPRRTTVLQLQVLRNLGFNRISLGVQDFNEKIQRLINRVQPFSITKDITDHARKLGFESVNFDLIYGLPQQDLESMNHTLDQTLLLRPDRIAFYSFALVPWIKPAQRLFADSDLPQSQQKRALYELARQRFLQAGYTSVGMDHFALPTDQLSTAMKEKSLHRNFMGYTDKKTDLLLGLGVSSISESRTIFHQNEKLLPKYQGEISKGQLPTHRGHILTEQDQKRRAQILKIMTQFSLKFENEQDYLEIENQARGYVEEGLISLDSKEIKVLEAGQPFLRNICSLFDEYIPKSQDQKLFSKSI